MDERQTILVVEDSDEHFEAVRRAFRLAEIANPVRRCCEGDEAIDYLRGGEACGSEECGPRPALILMDLNLPGTDGRDVLRELKGDPELSGIPVVILTTSSNPQDIRRCYRDGASSYIIKPIRFDDFLETVRTLRRYWLETVALPTP